MENSERDGNTIPPDLPLEKPIGKVTVVCVETFYGALSIRQFENVSIFNSGLLAQLCFLHHTVTIFPPACQCRTHRGSGSIPRSGRSSGGGQGNPVWYSFLAKSMD